VLKDIDVFITTVSGPAAPLQVHAVEAAAKAGVKLFIPLDWGGSIWTQEGLWQQGQRAVHTAAEQVGLKTASFFCGFWPEWLVESHENFGWNLDAGKITIFGEGKTQIPFTSKPDVARYVVRALTTFTRDVLEGGEFYIQGQSIVRRLLSMFLLLPFQVAGCANLQLYGRLYSSLLMRCRPLPPNLSKWLSKVASTSSIGSP
jgi:hypothetical protein